MKKLVIAVVFLLTGCLADPTSSSTTTNPEIRVGLLFEHEGCKVFRFFDGSNGGPRYYAVCGAMGAPLNTVTESCGKNCTRTVQRDVPVVGVAQ